MGGGGGDLHVPKEIWSPTGGFFADPKNWRRNFVFAAFALAGMGYLGFRQSIKMEQRHARPNDTIPSQRWYTEKNFPAQQ
ncbi:hypothetical protein C2E20_8074 [Micractinium conductrix]|uniref:Uncharacterized protein n=1 Tax=Micractinium conductrix TaxID=554055 RepID=A0A2P6V2M2_9CHLO|nr:hypothetical protein C2E20_8074 [Micractinium conductrix]|eukprot:PSC68345.1 hypothetical protein C2E20_8074 [Micractinium conductrix]